MNWDTIQQLIRIVAYSGGSFFFGDAVANGELFQAAIGGGLAVVAFIWWYVKERSKPVAPK